MPYKLNPLAPLNLCYYEDVETIGDTRYLLLDQITPQTIINGMPIFDAGIQVGHQGEDYTCYFELTQTDALGGGSIPYLKGFSSQASNNMIALDAYVEIIGGDGTTLSPAKLLFVDVDNSKSIGLYYDSANTALRAAGSSFNLDLGSSGELACNTLHYTTLNPEIAWGVITGTLSDQTDLQTALDGKAPAPHNLGGADHNVDTFANLNGKVSDSNLIKCDNKVYEIQKDGTDGAEIINFKTS